MKEFCINENDAGQRLDKFVLKVTVALPKSLLYKAIRTKKIKVNRKRCEPGQILEKGNTVQLFLSPDFFGAAEDSFRNLTPSVFVVYEDENILVADKPCGQSCHSDAVQKTGTLIDHIKAYLSQKGEFCPESENSFSPALCHRLDRNTSGLVICAKSALALREMNEVIRERQVEKEYLAWCHGKLEAHQTVTVYLKKDERENRVLVSPVPAPGYLTSITEIRPRLFDPKRNRTLFSIVLHTGRTHQIRATLSFLGHPLVGDSKYGKDRKDPDFSHQALRAVSLSFHPSPASPLSYLENVRILAPDDPLFCPKQ